MSFSWVGEVRVFTVTSPLVPSAFGIGVFFSCIFIYFSGSSRPGAGKYNALFSIERPEGRVLRKRRRWGIILIFFSPFDFSFVSLKETFAVENQGEGNFLHKDSATIWFNYIGSEAIKARLTGISMISVSALILHSWSLKLHRKQTSA